MCPQASQDLSEKRVKYAALGTEMSGQWPRTNNSTPGVTNLVSYVFVPMSNL